MKKVLQAVLTFRRLPAEAAPTTVSSQSMAASGGSGYAEEAAAKAAGGVACPLPNSGLQVPLLPGWPQFLPASGAAAAGHRECQSLSMHQIYSPYAASNFRMVLPP